MKLFLVALALAAPATARTPDWSRAKSVTVTMTEGGFLPSEVSLRSGRPYVLHVVNRTDKGHNLTQKSFFADARIASTDRPLAGSGKIVVPAHGGVTLRLEAPDNRPGATYQFTSTVLGDAGSDYKGVFRIR